MDIKPGDIVAVKGTGWISEEIESITHSIYSHIAVVIKDNEIIEAEGFRKTGYNGLDAYQGMADIYTCDQATDEQRQGIVDYLKKQVGGHYSYLLLVWEYVRYKTGILLPYDPGPNRICSYLAADAYRKNVLNLWPGIRFPSPGDVPKPLRLVGAL